MRLINCVLILLLLLSMTIKGSGSTSTNSQACAACKYQRRRCTSDCPLAAYFPADKPKMFQNAHRLFGVCNITKILRGLTDDQKDEAMKSIIYESDIRARFPVHGCLFVIWQLRYQIKMCELELNNINQELNNIKLLMHQGNSNSIIGNEEDVDHHHHPNSQFQLGQVTGATQAETANDNTTYYHHHHPFQQLYQYSNNNEQLGPVSDEGLVESSNNNAMLWMQDSSIDNSMMMESQPQQYFVEQNIAGAGAGAHLEQQPKVEVETLDFSNMDFAALDDTQSYLDSKLDTG